MNVSCAPQLKLLPLTNNIVVHLENRLDDMEEALEAVGGTAETPKSHHSSSSPVDSEHRAAMDASFMSESIYEKLPSPRTLKHKGQRP
jgi:division protein 1